MDRINGHTIVSFWKSCFRILGLVWVLVDLKIGIILLLIAEVVGVIEELV